MKTVKKINDWYKLRRISAEIKELLIVVTTAFFEYSITLESEIKELKLSGNRKLAETLGIIQKHVIEGNAQKIKNDYFEREKSFNEESIIILKESIAATEVLFAFDDTKLLYEELIKKEPNANNYFNFGYFLQKLNYFSEAIINYKVALQIYRDLAKENPRTYLPDVAMTLNNLAVLQKAKNEFPDALANYEEALQIRRDLAKENPKIYDIDYAKTVLMGVVLFQKDKKDLEHSKKILVKYLQVPLAQKLLEMIENME